MPVQSHRAKPVFAGDLQGRGDVYDALGRLLRQPSESVLGMAEGWDMHVSSPWRRVLPKVIFLGFSPKVSSRLYVTSTRIVLIRDIDPSREVAGELTLLGSPTAIAKGVKLSELRAVGVRQFCEVTPTLLRLVRSRKSTDRGSLLSLFLEDSTRVRYAISYWKTDGQDSNTLSLLESRFRR